MALAFSQTYNFRHYLRAYDGNSTYLGNKGWFYEFKEAFLAAGWTLMGSHDGHGNVDNSGITANVDGLGAGAGVDHWVSPEEIYKSPSSADPWIVLQSPLIMGQIQMMFGTDYASGDSQLHQANIWISPSGSFMAANGGTDGASNALPTAPDQIVHQQDTSSLWDTQSTHEIHAAWSDDLSQFFLFSTQENNLVHFTAFCKLDNAPANLQDGMVWFSEGSDTSLGDNRGAYNKMDNADHYTSAQWYGVIDGTNRALFCGGRGWNNVGIQSQQRPANDGKVVLGPCELYGSSVAVRGYLGTVPDMYWGVNALYMTGLGDSVGGPINWFSGGSIVIPWDNTQRLPRIR